MSRLLNFVACVLATLWLPATVHCQLEGVGLETLFACADSAADPAHATGDPCTEDGCQTIENGEITVTKSRMDVASFALPAIAGLFCLFEIPAPTPASEFAPSRQDQALPRQRTWNFARRAALPARAPDSLNNRA